MIRTFLISIALLGGTATAQTAAAPSIEERIESDMIAMTNMPQALARNLGQLHYLRTLCFGPDDQTWRNYAQTMMDIEADGDSVTRSSLVKAFNDGYYDQRARFPQCNDKVGIDAAALAENARHLAAMLGDPYRE